MGTLERSKRQTIITSTILTTMLMAAVTLAVLLVSQANHISHATTSVTAQAGIGPVTFFRLHKAPIGDGNYQASIEFLTGFFAYLAAWGIAAFGAITLRLRGIRLNAKD